MICLLRNVDYSQHRMQHSRIAFHLTLTEKELKLLPRAKSDLMLFFYFSPGVPKGNCTVEDRRARL